MAVVEVDFHHFSIEKTFMHVFSTRIELLGAYRLAAREYQLEKCGGRCISSRPHTTLVSWEIAPWRAINASLDTTDNNKSIDFDSHLVN